MERVEQRISDGRVLGFIRGWLDQDIVSGTPRDTPDEETTDWRAVCGKTARAIRRAGRREPFPTPIIDGLNRMSKRDE